MNHTDSKKKTVVIVDDTPSILQALALTVENGGYKVITAWNGEIALNAIDSLDEAPYALITDFDMPRMNGIELMQKLSSADIRIEKVILISASPLFGITPLGMVSSSLGLMSFTFLEKPFSPEVQLEQLDRPNRAPPFAEQWN